MKSIQPKFEQVKTLFHQSFYRSDKANNSVLMERVKNTGAAYFNVRKQAFDIEFNEWLNHIDIRQAGALIDILKENKVDMPAWMKNKSFEIDYNDKGALDLFPK